MKKIFLLFLFSLFLFPAFAVECEDEENVPEEKHNEEDDVFKIEKITPYKLRHSVSPKKEQSDTKLWVQKSLDKDKANFHKRVDYELKLLHNESEALDYHP